MLFEIIMLTIFVFVAIKFVKDDDEKPKVIKISAEEQKQIIDSEIGINQSQQSKELIIEEIDQDIQIKKINLNYQKESNETIINIYLEKSEVQSVELIMLDKKQKILTTTNVNIPYLEDERQTRVNIVLNGDYREVERVQIRKEK